MIIEDKITGFFCILDEFNNNFNAGFDKKTCFLLSFDATTIGYCYCDGQMCEFIGLFADAKVLENIAQDFIGGYYSTAGYFGELRDNET